MACPTPEISHSHNRLQITWTLERPQKENGVITRFLDDAAEWIRRNQEQAAAKGIVFDNVHCLLIGSEIASATMQISSRAVSLAVELHLTLSLRVKHAVDLPDEPLVRSAGSSFLAELEIYSDSLTPDEIASRLGVEASYYFTAEDSHDRKNPVAANGWFLALESTRRLPGQLLQTLLRLMAPASKTLGGLHETCTVNLGVALFLSENLHSAATMSFDPAVLELISNSGYQDRVSVSFYFAT